MTRSAAISAASELRRRSPPRAPLVDAVVSLSDACPLGPRGIHPRQHSVTNLKYLLAGDDPHDLWTAHALDPIAAVTAAEVFALALGLVEPAVRGHSVDDGDRSPQNRGPPHLAARAPSGSRWRGASHSIPIPNRPVLGSSIAKSRPNAPSSCTGEGSHPRCRSSAATACSSRILHVPSGSASRRRFRA